MNIEPFLNKLCVVTTMKGLKFYGYVQQEDSDSIRVVYPDSNVTPARIRLDFIAQINEATKNGDANK